MRRGVFRLETTAKTMAKTVLKRVQEAAWEAPPVQLHALGRVTSACVSHGESLMSLCVSRRDFDCRLCREIDRESVLCATECGLGVVHSCASEMVSVTALT